MRKDKTATAGGGRRFDYGLAERGGGKDTRRRGMRDYSVQEAVSQS